MNKFLALMLFGAVATAGLQSTAIAAPAAEAAAGAAAAAPAKQAPKPSKFVSKKQTALKTAGFDPGPIDGVIGKKTREALRGFQKANNLKETGRLDKATIAALKKK